MKVQTKDLTGAALDWAVEKSNGTHWVNGYFCYPENDPDFSYPFTRKTRLYSTDWAQGGPIIERERIEINPPVPEWCDGREDKEWMATSIPAVRGDSTLEVGPTPLIAAMRCYVASKLGDEVDVPQELVA